MMDSVTALFALEGVRQTGIGRGPPYRHSGGLVLGTDAIGHDYGPDSREAHENEMRLDETIGWFLDSLYAMRDSGSVLIALTADHGVSRFPALARRAGGGQGERGLLVSLREHSGRSSRVCAPPGATDGASFSAARSMGLDRAGCEGRSTPTRSWTRYREKRTRCRAWRASIARVTSGAPIMRSTRSQDAGPIRSHQFAMDLVITLTRYSYWVGPRRLTVRHTIRTRTSPSSFTGPG